MLDDRGAGTDSDDSEDPAEDEFASGAPVEDYEEGVHRPVCYFMCCGSEFLYLTHSMLVIYIVYKQTQIPCDIYISVRDPALVLSEV